MKTTSYAACALTAAAALTLAGCGGSGSSSGSATSPSAGSTRTGVAGGGFGGGAGRQPGVNGLVAAVTGTTLQVQGTGEQTAVTYTSSTRITASVATTATALKVGDCVSARPATRAAGSSTPTAGGRSPTVAPTMPTSVAAATVQIVSTGASGCTFGRGAVGQGGGTPPNGTPSGIPTDRPTGGTSGAPGAGAGGPRGFGGFGGFGAIGTVASIGDGTFTVTAQGLPSGTGTTATPRTVTVTWSGTTRFEATRTATAAAVKVGQCAAAQGKADTTGAVTATTLAISAPVDGRCTGGFRRG